MRKLLLMPIILLLMTGCGMTSVNTTEKGVLIIGHRGAMGYAPEHTLESFRLAVEMGVDYLEFDVQMTKDGVLVAIHDTDVSRTTNSKGEVKDLTIEEIKNLDAGSWFNGEYPQYYNEQYSGIKIPTVREIFEEFGSDVNYSIEIKAPQKYPGIEEKLVDLLKEYDLLGRKGQVILYSASKESLMKTHKLVPDTELGLLLWYTDTAKISDEELNEVREYVTYIVPNFDYLTEEYVNKVKDAGYKIQTYTVNNLESFYRLKEWGIDGIITNYPDILIKELEHTAN